MHFGNSDLWTLALKVAKLPESMESNNHLVSLEAFVNCSPWPENNGCTE
jgi:hypothetical protein